MTTLAERPVQNGLGEVHDRLESAYFSLARTSGRWYERRTPEALMGGFAGLDSATMNRVALLAAPDERGLSGVLREADAFFAERNVPWSVQCTPLSRPAGVERHLEARGFSLALELSVMTWDSATRLPSCTDVADVREIEPDELAKFTALTVEAFRMPQRFYPALADVNEAWAAAGARGFLATIDDEPIGTALLAPRDGVTGVYNVATLRGWRRRGVATLLMHRLIEEHLADGGGLLTLQVATGTPAEALYERLGFRTRYHWRLFTR